MPLGLLGNDQRDEVERSGAMRLGQHRLGRDLERLGETFAGFHIPPQREPGSPEVVACIVVPGRSFAGFGEGRGSSLQLPAHRKAQPTLLPIFSGGLTQQKSEERQRGHFPKASMNPPGIYSRGLATGFTVVGQFESKNGGSELARGKK